MATITSPRPSSIASSSSRRTSLDTVTRSQASSPSRAPQPQQQQQRRNRAALRDYYGLKNAALPAEGPSSGLQRHEEAADEGDGESELDGEGFDAERYVAEVLGREGLEGVLRIEGGLINEIRGLDSERKALVYDNYSKLITATDTICKMRTNMGPLIPTTSMLTPAISHIAETTAALGGSLKHRAEIARSRTSEEAPDKKQRDTVRWVINSPGRFRRLVEEERREEAMKEWDDVRRLLERWKGIAGAEEVRSECEKVLEVN